MALDLAHLMQLRLVVARYGEMDLAQWWNSKGMLGRNGATVLRRGFSKTACFVQARVVFTIARDRSQELFNPPQSVTLWNLPVEVEERFEEEWHQWLEQTEEWQSFFQALQNIKCDNLLSVLGELDLVSAEQQNMVAKLRRSAEGKGVLLSGQYEPSDEIMTLLAAGFSQGETGKPAIPYIRKKGV